MSEKGQARIIEVYTCYQCPHRDHSGGYTKGGAFMLCNKTSPPRKLNPRAKPSTEPFHGRDFDGEIPAWCPLTKMEKES